MVSYENLCLYRRISVSLKKATLFECGLVRQRGIRVEKDLNLELMLHWI